MRIILGFSGDFKCPWPCARCGGDPYPFTFFSSVFRIKLGLADCSSLIWYGVVFLGGRGPEEIFFSRRLFFLKFNDMLEV